MYYQLLKFNCLKYHYAKCLKSDCYNLNPHSFTSKFLSCLVLTKFYKVNLNIFSAFNYL